MAKKRSKQKGEKSPQAVVGIAIVVVVLGGVAWWLMSNRSGSADLAKAFNKLEAVETAQVEAELILNLPERQKGKARPFTKVNAQISGQAERNQEGGTRLTGDLTGEARGKGNIFFVEGDIRILEETVLFNLSDFPTLLNSSGSLVDKWTVVNTELLQTKNPEAIKEAMTSLAGKFDKVGVEKVNDVRATRFRINLSEEDEQRLAEVLRLRASGNKAWDVVARLLEANRLASWDIYIDQNNGEIVKSEANFVRPLSDGSEFDFATLTLALTDYDETVAIDVPEAELSVKASVFAKLFGSGEIGEISN